MSKEDSPFDLVVVGGGPGGYVASLRAAKNGLRVACIEDRPLMGGTCLHVGCIPSKALLEATALYAFAQVNSQELGVQYSKIGFDFPIAQKRKGTLVQNLGEGVGTLMQKHGITLIHGKARLHSPHEVMIEGKSSSIVQGRNILLATGSFPIALPHAPFDEKQILSSTGALELSEVPKTMAVVGGGVIGVELASVYLRLGCKVTVIEMLDHLCDPMDLDIRRHLLSELRQQGMLFFLSMRVEKIEKEKKGCRIHLGGEEPKIVDADVVLVAVGRKPNSQSLGLEEVGIRSDKSGLIQVDENFQTGVPHIFAIGDLIEGPMLAHRASAEGNAVAEYLSGNQVVVNMMAIPNIIYTDPEAALVGWTEQEAKKAGIPILVGRSLFKANPRARCEGKIEGFVKVIGEKRSGKLIGLHILGPHASELIHVGSMLIQLGGKVADLAHSPIGHPTLSEALKEAAESAIGKAIHE